VPIEIRVALCVLGVMLGAPIALFSFLLLIEPIITYLFRDNALLVILFIVSICVVLVSKKGLER
jgi:hypothetical protein